MTLYAAAAVLPVLYCHGASALRHVCGPTPALLNAINLEAMLVMSSVAPAIDMRRAPCACGVMLPRNGSVIGGKLIGGI